MKDCVKKGRQAKGDMLSDKRGEKTHLAKLKNNDVLEIRRLSGIGRTNKSIAEEFGVSTDNIKCIIKRKTWRHI